MWPSATGAPGAGCLSTENGTYHVSMTIRLAIPMLLGGVLPVLLGGRAGAFEIFCVPGGDGTQSCQRLDGGAAAIVCVDSPSGIRTCTNPGGDVFTCVRSRGNVYSCSSGEGVGTGNTRCQPTGDGTWACDPPAEGNPLLLPSSMGDSLDPNLIDPGSRLETLDGIGDDLKLTDPGMPAGLELVPQPAGPP